MDETKNNNPEWGILDPENLICHVLAYVWILSVKSMITNIQP